MKKLIILFIFIPSLLAADSLNISKNNKITSFRKAKILAANLYLKHKSTFYCGCSYIGKKIDWNSCGYSPKNKTSKRAKKLEWEHVVPAHAFGQSFKSWREGDQKCVTKKGKSYKGRRCAKKVDKTFKLMEADMYNLVPSVGEINGLRSNYSFTIIPGEIRKFGKCDFEVSNRTAEPTESVRGDIARTYFYMESAYPGKGIVSRKNRKLFKAWDKMDPVDRWECERSRKIQKIQGNINRIVQNVCNKVGL